MANVLMDARRYITLCLATGDHFRVEGDRLQSIAIRWLVFFYCPKEEGERARWLKRLENRMRHMQQTLIG